MRGDEAAALVLDQAANGLPPQARGREGQEVPHRQVQRTTPAGAGTSASPATAAPACSDHPRMRGDEDETLVQRAVLPGPPPQARGRGHGPHRLGPQRGTTPAGAGTRAGSRAGRSRPGDHPRRRGDERRHRPPGAHRRGPPPQARGRASRMHKVMIPAGTTPAGAGTSMPDPLERARAADHPRRRGDEVLKTRPAAAHPGPPPQARGRATHEFIGDDLDGTTPAGAGTRCPAPWPAPPDGDHPRRRGDEIRASVASPKSAGPPPQARGRGGAVPGDTPGARTTPAGAGTSRDPRGALRSTGDHPRRRGDELAGARYVLGRPGPPPQARGRGPGVPEDAELVRTTPAGAGTRRRGRRCP